MDHYTYVSVVPLSPPHSLYQGAWVLGGCLRARVLDSLCMWGLVVESFVICLTPRRLKWNQGEEALRRRSVSVSRKRGELLREVLCCGACV